MVQEHKRKRVVTRKKMISTEGVAQHANAGALRAVSIFLCRRLVDVH